MKNRIISVLLVAVLFVTAVVPVSAVGFDLPPDTDSVNLWNTSLKSPANTVLNALAEAVGASPVVNTVFWYYMDNAVGSTGPHTLDYMNDLVGRYHQAFNSEPGESFLLSALKGSQALGRQSFASCFFAQGFLDFELAKAPSGLYRIREKNSGRWVVNSSGQYPYCEGGSQAPTCGGNQWIGERSCSTAKVNMKNLDVLNLLCNKIKESGTACELRALGTKYKAIWYNRQYYCDPEGRPFVCYANEGQAAVNQDRPDTSVTDEKGKPAKDETGTVINNPDNSTNIDLSGMTITLPNGDVQVTDAVIYDESNKTYYIDSHDTTNYNITYNYSWTYYINYTSITYIGQTAEYDKKYEVYYELPDGRDSADLTAADLEQIDFNIDVVGYGRTADDTSLRSLYHFDGDTRDSSYWNYCTSFNWVTGASLTYMDAGAFNGALYLDENSHAFYMDLPSNIGTDDFTMQFRYYQSATAAPQTDSQIVLFSNKDYSTHDQLFSLDGKTLKTNLNSNIIVTYSTGTWNEICVERMNGFLWYFLNGVVVGGPVADSAFYYNRIWFDFGSAQQTFKYLDEFRFTNKKLYSAPYTCSSVPYDTNLSLVLPDSTKPVADEYWSFDKTITPLESYLTKQSMKQSRVIAWAQKHPGKFSAWLLASKFLKRCTPVYSNVPITGAFQLEPQNDIGKYMISGGKVIIDEAGIEYNNRNFKSFPKEAIYWYKYHRHYECSVDVFSQSYEDMDITLKRLAQNYFVVKKSLLPFCIVCKSIKRKIGIDDTTHQIIDKYYFGLPIIGAKWVFSPVLWKLFNSYSRKELPEKEWAKW